MITREEVILLHYEYDPVKAHEYYMRNRQLKGRKPAVRKTSTPSMGPNAAAKSGAQLSQKPVITKPNAAKAKAQAQVAVIQKRLNALNNVLKGLEAEKRAADKKASDKKASDKKATSSTSNSSGPNRKLTAKQKADNNKRSKDYYKDNKEEIAKKNAKEAKPKEKTLDEKITYVKDQIKKVKVELAVAKVKAGIK